MIARLAITALFGLAPGLNPPAWTDPIAPFPVAGPIHYVGTIGLAAYLIVTRDGAILIDAPMDANVAAIERNIIATGVPLKSVRILLNSHAHFDHAGGLAQLRRDTGARLMVMRQDVQAISTGHPTGDNPANSDFAPAPVDRVLNDGDRVSLGGVTLTAWRTGGHTPGCTSWTMTIIDNGRPRRVIFPCSLTVAGNVLRGNRGYPGIVGDYRASFARLGMMRADIVLTAHPEFADVLARGERRAKGDKDAFVDSNLLPRLVADSKAAFEKALAAAPAPPCATQQSIAACPH